MAATRKPRHSDRSRRPPGQAGTDRIFGLHAAQAALQNARRRILGVLATENAALRLAETLAQRNIQAQTLTASALSSQLGGDAVHQGILVEAEPLPEVDLDTVLARISTDPAAGPAIVLDQVTDPHNVGAILRSAAAFGAAALVMTRRHSPPCDGVLAKAASGAVEHVPVVKVTNLARALDEIGAAGLVRVGLDGAARDTLRTAPLEGPCALVLGAEDKGLRRLTRENCDFLCCIATRGPIASLNVSNAAAIALHTCLSAHTAHKP